MYTCRIRRYTVLTEVRETYAYDFVQADRTRVLEFGVWSPRLCKTSYQGSRPRACFWQRHCNDARTWWTPQIRCIMGVVSWCCTRSRTGPVAVRDGDRRSRLTVRITWLSRLPNTSGTTCNHPYLRYKSRTRAGFPRAPTAHECAHGRR